MLLIVAEGILQGSTNQCAFLNIIMDMIADYTWPGKAIVNLLVEWYSHNAVKNVMDIAQDLKLGQYMINFIPYFTELYVFPDSPSVCPILWPDQY